jgi:hypothetical protein
MYREVIAPSIHRNRPGLDVRSAPLRTPSGLPLNFAPRRIPLGEENHEYGPQAEHQGQGARREGGRQRPQQGAR